MYDVTQLPPVDGVEVLILGVSYSSLSKPQLYTSYGSDGISILESTHVYDTRAVTAICEMWRSLPSGEQDRCHRPPFGLRFIKEDNIVLDASICWECNNIWIKLPDDNSFPYNFHGYNFNGRSEPAQRLLRLLRYLSGEYFMTDLNSSLSINDYL